MRLQFEPMPKAKLRFHTVALSASSWRRALCIVTALVSLTGCRSSMPPLPKLGMPKLGMFGFKREPSPEALAGVGPTTTYPMSPSSGITPEAIASTAAGSAAPSGMKPQTASVAGMTSGLPAQGTAATQPGVNSAAAGANGFYGANGRGGTASTPSTASTPGTYANATGASGGFSYGQNPAISKPTSSPTAPGGLAAIPAGYVPPKPPAPQASIPAYAQTNSATGTPAPTVTPTKPASPPSAGSYTVVPGYPLPSGPTPTTNSATTTAPAFAMPPDASMAAGANPITPAAGSFTMPGNTSAATLPAASGDPAAHQATAPNRVSAPKAPSTGYKPGSTSGAVGYPSTGGYPATGSSDSFYR